MSDARPGGEHGRSKDTEMRAISLWQPWASLVALGIKTIETRSWETKYRGPLVIHAAKRKPARATFDDWFCDPNYRCDPLGPTEPRLWRSTTKPGDLFGTHESRPLPLGAFIARCNLVDCVPMRSYGEPSGSTGLVLDCPDDGHLDHQAGGLWLIGVNDLTHGYPTYVEDQRPFGDYAPGRFAWLLADIEAIEPEPATGRQGLWRCGHNGGGTDA